MVRHMLDLAPSDPLPKPPMTMREIAEAEG